MKEQEQEYVKKRSQRGLISRREDFKLSSNPLENYIIWIFVVLIVLFIIGYAFPITNQRKPDVFIRILNGFFASIFFTVWLIIKIITFILVKKY